METGAFRAQHCVSPWRTERASTLVVLVWRVLTLVCSLPCLELAFALGVFARDQDLVLDAPRGEGQHAVHAPHRALVHATAVPWAAVKRPGSQPVHAGRSLRVAV